MLIFEKVTELQFYLKNQQKLGKTIGFVPTMGALHEGHASLVRAARTMAGADGVVVSSIFVNPPQFGPAEDFAKYPRTLDADVRVCDAAGADIVFAPDAVEVYGPAQGFREDSITVDPGPLGDILEGAARPGHFRGTLTVVAKLLGITRATLRKRVQKFSIKKELTIE